MPKSNSRTPDYNLNALNKDTDVKGRVGAAWKNEDGSISIQLDHWTILQGKGHSNCLYTLFPYETKEERDKRFKLRGAEAKIDKELEDDIPF